MFEVSALVLSLLHIFVCLSPEQPYMQTHSCFQSDCAHRFKKKNLLVAAVFVVHQKFPCNLKFAQLNAEKIDRYCPMHSMRRHRMFHKILTTLIDNSYST